MPAAPDEGRGACWVPLSAGVFKLNFDAGRVGTKERGWGFVIHDHLKSVVVAGVKQGQGFHGAEGMSLPLKKAVLHNFTRLVVEGNCISLINKLKAKEQPRSTVGSPINNGILITVNEQTMLKFKDLMDSKLKDTLTMMRNIMFIKRWWRDKIGRTNVLLKETLNGVEGYKN
ncbi:hypothetical protein Cgig2_018090 [Carnegiea gigantea]|uniref:RNase H type-1 domain-containing protein n=1 Tax=Carnegiea gigantea TaxID=171969 RepID=A0A9Q1JYV3_9CARY|nr:hypothetical protein Cgig2_018090 [Carnegiea gigantea]